jgi:response regulator RpfG family c-di-GMP phosphodiesterase
MKILIVEDDNDIRDILMFTFDSEISADYVYAGSGNEAVELIKSSDDIDLIVCDYNMPNGNGGVVYKFLLENSYTIPYVLCSSDSVDDHDVFLDRSVLLGHIVKPNIFEGVHETLIAYENMTKVSNPDADASTVERNEGIYTQVNTDLLLLAGVVPCSVYLKINDQKHIKVFNKGDKFSKEDYEKYANKEIQKLIIDKDSVEAFVLIVASKINTIIECDTTENEDKVLDIHSVIMDTISSLGLSEQVIRATEQSIEFSMSIFKKNKEFKDIYKNIFGHEGKYLTKHSIALVYITNGILAKTSWDSPENRNKLALAGFFHDAAIKVSEFTELSEHEIENITLKNFKEHAGEAAKLLSKLKGVPSDLDRIVLDHHERPDGSGLPRGLSGKQIQPLSAIFIFSHDVVDAIFALEKKSLNLSKDNLETELKSKLYEEGHFKKCYEGFELARIFEGE